GAVSVGSAAACWTSALAFGFASIFETERDSEPSFKFDISLPLPSFKSTWTSEREKERFPGWLILTKKENSCPEPENPPGMPPVKVMVLPLTAGLLTHREMTELPERMLETDAPSGIATVPDTVFIFCPPLFTLTVTRAESPTEYAEYVACRLTDWAKIKVGRKKNMRNKERFI